MTVMFRSNGIVPSFLIGEHFYTPQYSLPARKSAPQSKMNHRYSEKYLKPTLLNKSGSNQEVHADLLLKLWKFKKQIHEESLIWPTVI